MFIGYREEIARGLQHERELRIARNQLLREARGSAERAPDRPRPARVAPALAAFVRLFV